MDVGRVRKGRVLVELRVDHQTLAEAVAWSARSLPARPALPVLAGMLIDASADGLTLSSFDYEVSGEATIDAEVTEPGRLLVPGRLLADIVRSLSPQPVDISLVGAEVVVRCGAAEFGLHTMAVEDYPTLPDLPDLAGTVASDVFTAAITQVVLAASRDDSLPMLTGVRVEIERDTISLASTDRYRIAARELTWSPADPGFTATAVVPARTLADAAKTLRPGTDVSIALTGDNDTLLGIESNGRRMTTRLLDDQYIDYRSRLAGEWETQAEVRTAPFVEAIKRVALVTERNTPIRLAFDKGEVRIRAASGDSARANESLPADLTGAPVEVAFNPQFLLDGLTGIGTDLAQLHCSGPTKAALITGRNAEEDTPEEPPTYRYLVMPIRLNS